MPRGGSIILGLVTASSVACDCAQSRPTQDVEYGIGAKADDGGCDAGADLCWGVQDSATMREILIQQDALVFGAPDPAERATHILELVSSLSHKLDVHERTRIAALQADAAGLDDPEDIEAIHGFISELAAAGLERLQAGHAAAYLVPTGAEALGDEDASFRMGTVAEPKTWTADMHESLLELESAGPLGRIYGFMLQHTGVLDRPYLPFDEIFPFSEPREDRARRIIRRWQTWAGVSAGTAGLETLIPVAGVAVSFSHNVFFNFRIRTRMSLELAALYGIDIREGDQLLHVVTALMAQESLGTIRNEVIGWAAARWLADAALRKGLAVNATAIVRRLVSRMLERMLHAIVTEGAEIATRLAARGTAAAAGKQLLGSTERAGGTRCVLREHTHLPSRSHAEGGNDVAKPSGRALPEAP